MFFLHTVEIQVEINLLVFRERGGILSLNCRSLLRRQEKISQQLIQHSPHVYHDINSNGSPGRRKVSNPLWPSETALRTLRHQLLPMAEAKWRTSLFVLMLTLGKGTTVCPLKGEIIWFCWSRRLWLTTNSCETALPSASSENLGHYWCIWITSLFRRMFWALGAAHQLPS